MRLKVLSTLLERRILPIILCSIVFYKFFSFINKISSQIPCRMSRTTRPH